MLRILDNPIPPIPPSPRLHIMTCEDIFCLEYFAGVATVTGGFRLLAQGMLQLQISSWSTLNDYLWITVIREINNC